MEPEDIPPQISGPLRHAAELEPLFAVPSAALDRIAAATAPTVKPGVLGPLREIVLTLAEVSAGGLKPAFRAGSDAAHAVRKVTYSASGLRLTLMLEPSSPGLPLGLPADYRVLGRLTLQDGAADDRAQGAKAGELSGVVAMRGPDGSYSTTLDEHGFFEVTVSSGVYRLEIALAQTRVVVPQLEVGVLESP